VPRHAEACKAQTADAEATIMK